MLYYEYLVKNYIKKINCLLRKDTKRFLFFFFCSNNKSRLEHLADDRCCGNLCVKYHPFEIVPTIQLLLLSFFFQVPLAFVVQLMIPWLSPPPFRFSYSTIGSMANFIAFPSHLLSWTKHLILTDMSTQMVNDFKAPHFFYRIMIPVPSESILWYELRHHSFCYTPR